MLITRAPSATAAAIADRSPKTSPPRSNSSGVATGPAGPAPPNLLSGTAIIAVATSEPWNGHGVPFVQVWGFGSDGALTPPGARSASGGEKPLSITASRGR